MSPHYLTKLEFWGGGMAEWLAFLGSMREIAGSNTGGANIYKLIKIKINYGQ